MVSQKENLEESFSKFFDNLTFEKKIKVLIACSGGVDSVALVNVTLKFKNYIELVGIIHVDHNIRPESSDDAKFVRSLAERNNIKYFELSICPLKSDVTNEEWGREVRYNYFAEVIDNTNSDFVMTAHHANDEIETFLFKLFLGRNNSSLSLIKPIDLDRKLLRPFLNIKKKSILEYSKKNLLEFREDSTNQLTSISRNYIRHEIVTKIEKLNPNYLEAISGFIDSIRQEKRFIEDYALSIFTENLADLSRFQKSVAFRILVEIAKRDLGVIFELLSHRRFYELFDFIQNLDNEEYRFDMGSGVVAVLDKKNIDKQITFQSSDSLYDIEQRILNHKNTVLKITPGESSIVTCPLTLSEYKITFLDNIENSVLDGNTDKILVDLDKGPIYLTGRPVCERLNTDFINNKRVARFLKESKLSRLRRESLFYISQSDNTIWISDLLQTSSNNKQSLYNLTVEKRSPH